MSYGDLRPETLAALKHVAPDADSAWFVDKDRHPRLYQIALSAKTTSTYSQLWRNGYAFFGDEMEDALDKLSGSDQGYRSPTTALVESLDDPWIVTGYRATDLGDDFFRLWENIRPRERPRALGLVNDAVPTRARELLDWLGGSFDVPKPYNPDTGSATGSILTWARLFGRKLRMNSHPASSLMDKVTEEYQTAVTIGDVYEFLDSGVRANQKSDAPSLQMQLAERRGALTPERRALTRVGVHFPTPIPGVMHEHWQTTNFLEDSDWAGDARVKALRPPDYDKFESILEGTDGFSLEARRERLALALPDREDYIGRTMSPAQERMWETVIQRAVIPEDWFPCILNTEATVGQVDMVVGWMDTSRRVRGPLHFSSSWLEFVFDADRASSSWSAEVGATEEQSVDSLCRLIEHGVAYSTAQDFYHRGFSMEETVEVLIGGVPEEYVHAMRPPEPVAPF